MREEIMRRGKTKAGILVGSSSYRYADGASLTGACTVTQSKPLQAAPMATRVSIAERILQRRAQRKAVSYGLGPKTLIDGRYRVDGLLGVGGMGRVYRGWHLGLDQPVAIKVLRSRYQANDEAIALFLQEARVGAQLISPHVPRVLDCGRSAHGAFYMVSELLRGMDLRQLIDRTGPLAVEDAAEVLKGTCDAVMTVHSQGFVHRDLKPDNLFLARTEDGACDLKLLDFGIVKRLGSVGQALTNLGAGSPHYMSPEQVLSLETVDTRADIWSLGVVLYELLTGCVPFDGGTVDKIRQAVVYLEPKAPSKLRPNLDPSFDPIVLRCLAKHPDHRFASARELHQAICSAQQARANLPLTDKPLPRENKRPRSDRVAPQPAQPRPLTRNKARERLAIAVSCCSLFFPTSSVAEDNGFAEHAGSEDTATG